MLHFHSLNLNTSFTKPCVITIGNFDGVHLGHQMLINAMRTFVGPHGTVGLITFSNHPSHLLSDLPCPLIQSNSLKIKYLENLPLDFIVNIPFAKDLANLSYQSFLQKLREATAFDHLVLGEGAVLGKGREGTPERVEQLGKERGFQTHYLKKSACEQDCISSGRIRQLILAGQLRKATRLLGHPFEIEGQCTQQMLTPFSHQCLPPDGSYHASITHDAIARDLIVEVKNRRIYFLEPIHDSWVRLQLKCAFLD